MSLSITAQELESFKNIIKLSFDAFQSANDTTYFHYFLQHIVKIVQLGSAIVLMANVKLQSFSEELDRFYRVMREADWLIKCKKLQIEATQNK